LSVLNSFSAAVLGGCEIKTEWMTPALRKTRVKIANVKTRFYALHNGFADGT